MPSSAQAEQSDVNVVRSLPKGERIGTGVDGFQGVGGGRYVRTEDSTGKSETEEFGQSDELKLIKASEGQDWQALENLWYQYELDRHELDPFPAEYEQRGVDAQRLFATIERKIQQKIEKKYFAYVDSQNLKKDVDTRIITSRIKDHRLKGYLNHTGGEERVKSTWNKTTKVDIVVGPYNDVKIVLKATGDDNNLTMNIGDFFAMFSIPDVNNGFSRFQNMSIRTDSDIRKIVDFFERVSIDGKLIGDDHNIPPVVEIVSAKVRKSEDVGKPKEISKQEKAVLDYITQNHNTKWHSSVTPSEQYGSPSSKDKPSATDVNSRKIWKDGKR